MASQQYIESTFGELMIDSPNNIETGTIKNSYQQNPNITKKKMPTIS